MMDIDSRARLSVIIPLARGDRLDPGLLEHAGRHVDWQWIVAACTPRPADCPDSIEWTESSPGRGIQLNDGARTGENPWLWFLHADSRPDTRAMQGVARFASGEHQAIGYCQLEFLDDGPWLTRLNAWGANLRSYLFARPYGDQGLCMSRRVFERLGGFREDLERGEDLDLVVRAKLAGISIRAIGGRIATSARRYRDQGWLRTTWRHQCAARRLIRNARRHRRSHSS